jgi:hypothetical protein
MAFIGASDAMSITKPTTHSPEITMLTVLKPFKTKTRSFSAGQDIDAKDIDGALTAEQWQERGFLAVKPAENQSASAYELED